MTCCGPLSKSNGDPTPIPKVVYKEVKQRFPRGEKSDKKVKSKQEE